MSSHGFALFDTAIGCCGIAWGAQGIAAVQLPEPDAAATRTRLLRRCPDAAEASPTPEVQRTIADIVRLLDGEAPDLSYAALDMRRVPAFHRRVYDIARGIRPGGTLSYGEIAARLGDRAAAREVGEAMGKNPFPIIVPCHRVLGAGGKPGGFSAPGGVATKLRMLNIERARVGAADSLFQHLPMAVAPRR